MSGQNKTSMWSRVSCGLGGAFNAFWRHVSASFSLVFYMNVIGLTSGQAGLIRAVGQISSLFSTAPFGHLCDRVDMPFLSRRLGRKKTWHLLTSILLSFFFLLSFSQCFLCNDSMASWAPVAYFVVSYGVAAFLYAACEMTHLSIIPVIAQTQDEAVLLNSLR